MAKRWTSAQQDLFEEPPAGMPLAPAERAMALGQLQALLMEAMATLTDGPEAGDDQDHT